MNQSNEERGSSGINIKWPNENNSYFKDALKKAEDGDNPNNISKIYTAKFYFALIMYFVPLCPVDRLGTLNVSGKSSVSSVTSTLFNLPYKLK